MTPRSTVIASIALLGSFVLGRPVPAQGRPVLERDARVAEGGATMPVVLEGFVLASDGAPAEGAVVVSSAGGKAVVDRSGSYRLEVSVPLEAESVEITAVGAGDGNPQASARIAIHLRGRARVDPLQLVLGSSCEPRWLPTFGGLPGTDSFHVPALAVFDDGGGSALYAGGRFTIAGGVAANHVAKWDGSRWTPLGSGITYTTQPSEIDVNALAVYDDGHGPALYAAGLFTKAGGKAAYRIAKWNGSEWSTLGHGIGFASTSNNVFVLALCVYDDGSGPALYAGGLFGAAGDVTANGIAKWNGSSWTALGSGIPGGGTVMSLAAYDDGNGPALYAGGGFTSVGGVPASSIAKWDGSSWSALGLGAGGGGQRVLALTVYDDGGGAALVAGGDFTSMGGVAASCIAKWNGSTWSALGSGTSYWVQALLVHDDGSGQALFVGGSFSSAGGVPAGGIAKWDGASWSALDGTTTLTIALAGFDDGHGPALYTGGGVTGLPALGIARWDGASWSTLENGMDSSVSALTVRDEDGQKLYAGGSFTSAGGVAVTRVARWDGASWSALGAGLNDQVRALEFYDEGGGPMLFAGGDFTGRIARWDGASWSVPGGGVPGYNDKVRALEVYDDGSGPALYAAGQFRSAGGHVASMIARWDGASWSALGSGISGTVTSLTVYDDGGGPALYAGGIFATAGGVTVNRIARWDGSSWSALGSGMNGTVTVLATFDDGSGPALYAGGGFTTAGGVPVNQIAKWDGSSWSALGSGVNGSVMALVAHKDGSGPALYAGGGFTSAGGVAASRIAKWDGAAWTPLGSGVIGPFDTSGDVLALAVHDAPGVSRPALIAGGDFLIAPDSSDSFLARWGCSPPTVPGKVRAR